jgi:hypothetical protein
VHAADRALCCLTTRAPGTRIVVCPWIALELGIPDERVWVDFWERVAEGV